MLIDTITPRLNGEGYTIICGVDEAGRGPLAGPVCAAAVVFSGDALTAGVDDSKRLSEKRREALFDVIYESALSVGVAMIDNIEIDRVNILNAALEAMAKAVEALSAAPDIILIDGNMIPPGLKDGQTPAKSIIGGDGAVFAIAAASIIAKVTRDRYMRGMDELYPGYGFARHKGYGTAAHFAAIKECGLCPIHRLTFLSKIKNKG